MDDSTLSVVGLVVVILLPVGLWLLIGRKKSVAGWQEGGDAQPNRADQVEIESGKTTTASDAVQTTTSPQPGASMQAPMMSAAPVSASVSPSVMHAPPPSTPAAASSMAAPTARTPVPPADNVETPAKPAATTRSAPEIPTSRSLFISYRRQDSQHITGRIYDRLSARFGRDSVFKDVDSIPLGLDFREHLREQVGQCAVLVAVMGKNWNPPSASGQPRMNDPRDHLRIEIESALDRHIPVIPVLVDGIEMPSEDELPPSLASLAFHNGISVRPDPDFHHDADRLVRGIEQLLE